MSPNLRKQSTVCVAMNERARLAAATASTTETSVATLIQGHVARRRGKALPPSEAATAAALTSSLPQRQALLLHLGYLDGEMFCAFMKWSPKTLSNKAIAELPEHSKAGDLWLFSIDAVGEWVASKRRKS
jgi:hypothetical protein